MEKGNNNGAAENINLAEEKDSGVLLDSPNTAEQSHNTSYTSKSEKDIDVESSPAMSALSEHLAKWYAERVPNLRESLPCSE